MIIDGDSITQLNLHVCTAPRRSTTKRVQRTFYSYVNNNLIDVSTKSGRVPLYLFLDEYFCKTLDVKRFLIGKERNDLVIVILSGRE